MAKINLLPWRAERRTQREREFYMMLRRGRGGRRAGCVGCGGTGWALRLDNQDARNTYLKDQIQQLDGKLAEIKELEKTKSKLLARKQIIEQLQASRSQMVHLFDELVKTIPDGVRLSSLKQTGDTLTLQGVAQSNASVANYMRNLDSSQWLTRSDLQQDRSQGQRQAQSLRIRLDRQAASAGERRRISTARQPTKPAPAGSTAAAPRSGAAAPATIRSAGRRWHGGAAAQACCRQAQGASHEAF